MGFVKFTRDDAEAMMAAWRYACRPCGSSIYGIKHDLHRPPSYRSVRPRVRVCALSAAHARASSDLPAR